DQLGRQVGQPVDPTLRISIIDDNILALNPAELAQPLPERVEQGRPIGRGRQPKETYPRHLARLLLRTRRLRPRRCAAEQGDELGTLNWHVAAVPSNATNSRRPMPDTGLPPSGDASSACHRPARRLWTDLNRSELGS